MSALRLGLAGAALILYELALRLWITAAPFRAVLEAAPCFAAWLLGTIAAVLALTRAPDRRLRCFVLVAVVLSLWGHGWADWKTAAPLASDRSDDAMRTELAARALRHGTNPYTVDYAGGSGLLRDRGRLLTRGFDGTPESRLTAPALPTLTRATLDTLGLGTPRLFSLTCHTLLLALVFLGSPLAWQPVVLFPLLAARELAHDAIVGAGDVGCSTLLAGVALAWGRPQLAAVLFGAAGAWTQQAWLALPFVAVCLSGRRAARFVAIAAATFLAINLPFIVWGPTAWWLGVSAPLSGALDVVSDGLGALSQYGLVSLPPRFYTFLQAAAIVALVVVQWRHRAAIGHAFWVFPATVSWLHYRGPDHEWLIWLPPMIVALGRAGAEASTPAGAGTRSWRFAVVGGVGVAVVGMLVGAEASRERSEIGLAWVGVLEIADDGSVGGTTVEVTNSSSRTMAPRFAAQQAGSRPLPWKIVSGPDTVAPGATARYVVRADRWFERISRAGGQLLVTDGRGDYTLRALLTVPADSSLADPDGIVNGDFARWPRDGGAPYGWHLDTPESQRAVAWRTMVDGRQALVLSARGTGSRATARLTQPMTVPSTFWIWVRPPAPVLCGDRYGLELDDDRRVLTLLFGPVGAGPVSAPRAGDGRVHAAVTLPAQPGAWSRHRIDVAALWAQRGWDLPPPSRRDINGIEYATRQAWLRLVVSGRVRGADGVFGPIEPEPKPMSQTVAAALERPDGYWLALGVERYRQRNWQAARRAFERAADANRGSADAYSAIGWTILAEGGAEHRARCPAAEMYFEIALALQPSLPGPRLGLARCR